MIAWVSVVAILFFGWDYFPVTLTDKVEILWGKIVAAFRGVGK